MLSRPFSGVASVTIAFLCSCFSSQAAASGSFQDWQFQDDANPARPTIITNAAGESFATIAVGLGALGWQANLAGFGSQTGIWDLGFQNPEDFSRGQVHLNIPDPAGAKGRDYTDLELSVVQFVDGGFYKGDLTFSIPGASLKGTNTVEPLPPPFGGSWIEYHFQWRLAPSPTNISLAITGAVFGTVLDRIRVETAGPVGPPLVITSVQKSVQGLALSWTGAFPPYQIYASTNLDHQSWEMIGSSLSVTNADIALSGPNWFVKVGGSD